MKSGFKRKVDRAWLSGLSSGDNVAYEIHRGGIRAPVEKRGHASIVRAGRRHLEIGGDLFDGQISRETGLGQDGLGRTVSLKPVEQT